MTANETPAAGRGLENSAGGRVHSKDTTPRGHSPETHPASRTRPAALDTFTSSDAEAKASTPTLGLVKAGVLEILRQHPGTDDEIEAWYIVRTGHPRFPLVTGQRLRTARAHLVRDGLVRDSGAIAFSLLGNRACQWEAIV